jgi:hypothetical protein
MITVDAAMTLPPVTIEDMETIPVAKSDSGQCIKLDAGAEI